MVLKIFYKLLDAAQHEIIYYKERLLHIFLLIISGEAISSIIFTYLLLSHGFCNLNLMKDLF